MRPLGIYAAVVLLSSCATQTIKKAENLPEIVVPHDSATLEGVQHFTTKSSLAYLQKTASIANCILTKNGFYDEVVGSTFTHTDKTSEQVASDLKNIRVELKSYKTKLPWSKAIATTYPTDKHSVYFNEYKNPRDTVSMVKTALHEGSHTVGYSHGDNYYSEAKKNSVPYKLEEIGAKYVQECE